MAGYFTSSTSYAQIADSAALDFIPADGWTMSFFLYPVSADPQTQFGYIYSHAPPLLNANAINLIRDGVPGPTYGRVRIVIDWPGGNLVDWQPGLALVDNQWNTLVVSYDALTLRMHINGVTASTVPPSLPSVQPSTNARIGNSTASPIGSRWFPGRIAHAAQWSRAFPASDGEAWSGLFLSPEFAQNALDWHAPMFSNAVWDMQGVVSITAAGGMQWRRHSPTISPFSQMQGRGSAIVPPALNRVFAYYRAG